MSSFDISDYPLRLNSLFTCYLGFPPVVRAFESVALIHDYCYLN